MRVLAATAVAVLSTTVLAGCGGGQSIGDQATVSLDGKDVGVAVTKIEKGSTDDLRDYYAKTSVTNGDEIIGDKSLYYVHYTFTDTGGADLSGSELGRMSGIDDDGTVVAGASGLTVGEGDDNRFEPCPELAQAPEDFDSKGASFESCASALADSGKEIVGANYIPDDVSKTVKWQQ